MFYANEPGRADRDHACVRERARGTRMCVGGSVELTCFCSVRRCFIHGRPVVARRRRDDELRSSDMHAPSRIDINLIDIDTFVCVSVCCGVAALR